MVRDFMCPGMNLGADGSPLPFGVIADRRYLAVAGLIAANGLPSAARPAASSLDLRLSP